MTLKFLGEVGENRYHELEEALEGASHGTRPFTIEIGGAGAFPSARRPNVIWVGCASTPPLELLQDSIERRFHDLGFELEGRPFRPHVTIGRVRRGTRRNVFADLEDRLGSVNLEIQTLVSSVELMRSRLGSRGARYEVRYTAALDS